MTRMFWLVFLMGCAGSASLPVSVTTTTADGAQTKTLGQVEVPDSAYVPGCVENTVVPQPPALTGDLTALEEAYERAVHEDTLVDLSIGDFPVSTASVFGAEVSNRPTEKLNLETHYALDGEDDRATAALRDLLATIARE